MLDRGADQVPAAIPKKPRRAENGEIIGLRAPAGENNLARLGAKQGSRTVAGIIECSPRGAAEMVHARRISPSFVERPNHGLPDTSVDRSGRVVVEVNGFGSQHVGETDRRRKPSGTGLLDALDPE